MVDSPLATGFYSENSQSFPIPSDGTSDPLVVTIQTEEDDPLINGASKIETEDGGVVIDLNPPAKPADDSEGRFDENLALKLSAGDLGFIGSTLIEAITSDDKSRQEWLETRSSGIEMLGFKLEKPRTEPGSEGMSTVRHPLLSEAVIRFQSNAAGELYPAEGPCKIRNDASPEPPSIPGDNSPPPTGGAQLNSSDYAEALERDFNHYLTVVDKGYRADSVKMLFWVGFGGCAFKKVYSDPIKRRPVSRTVDAADLIVSNNANEIDDAGRVTHRIIMRRSVLKRMQIAGVYRDTPLLASPYYQPNVVDEKTAEVQGFTAKPDRQEDQPYTIYECYCELDLPGYEHKGEDGEVTGLELPYRVTIEKDSREILEIRRNWREEDETCMAKKVFVKFPFVPAMGFYDVGLLQILGNATKALTGAWRLMLDAGMFGSFPGFLFSEQAGRQDTNEFRIPPGGGKKIQTGGRPIGEVVMPLPYKDVGQGMMLLAKSVEESGQRVGGTAELQVAEGRQDAPVGTTLAMIEQATKMLAAVHINLHAAQSEELQLLKECFRDDPESFWRHNRRPAKKWEVDEFIKALDDNDLVPAADPNTPSHMHRIMKAMAIKQLQAASPTLYDPKAVDSRILRMINVPDPYSLFAPPAPPGPAAAPPPDAAKMAELQLKEKQMQQQAQEKSQQSQTAQQTTILDAKNKQDEMSMESADRAADRASRERVASQRESTEQIKVIGEMAQAGLVPPQAALAAAASKTQPFPQQAPAPVAPSLVPAKPGALSTGGAVKDPMVVPD